MSDDARFEDGAEHPLNLGAMDAEDLTVLSALAQDAVFPATEMLWRRSEGRFAILLNRFRWEDEDRARHGAERVQSVLVVDNVTAAASQGFTRGNNDAILSLLAIEFTPQDGTPGGDVVLTLAGDGAIRLTVEAIELRLRDVTRPYRAPSGKAPGHTDDQTDD